MPEVAAPPFDAEFTEAAEPYRRELFAHCYRMLGSAHDAEDQVQETMLRAWRSFGSYDPAKAGMRTWLYRIATNACLNALDYRGRRGLPNQLVEASDDPARIPQGRRTDLPWLQPAPDALLGLQSADPAAVVASRGSVRLAFVAALQYLPPRQRAVLILRDVLAWRAAEVADLLDTSVAAVNSALQRAKAQLTAVSPEEDSLTEPTDAAQRRMVERYAAAFETADLTTLEHLLREDAVLEMPPYLLWLDGRSSYLAFAAFVCAARAPGSWRLVPLGGANQQPAVGAYLRGEDGVFRAHSIQVYRVEGDGITHVVAFQEPELFGTFELPPTLAVPVVPQPRPGVPSPG
ncbi:MAG: sigma-70 family RNA polymerase sigma factor [Jatrophihabitans sp.]